MPKRNQKASGEGKKRSIFILLFMLIALASCGLAGYTLYQMKNMKSEIVEKGASTKPTKTQEIIAPLYVPLETFTVSLKPSHDENDRVLYIGLTLRVKDSHSEELLKRYLPELRSHLLIIFSEQTAEELSTNEGKAQLIEKIKTVACRPLAGQQSAVVTDVLFNAFILR